MSGKNGCHDLIPKPSHRQGKKVLAKPITDVKLGTSGHWVGTWTGAGVTATLV